MAQVKRHPEKRRIPIVCGLCDTNETTAGCGVCGECQETYRIGKDAERVRSTSAIECYFLPTHTYSVNVEFGTRGAKGNYRRVSFSDLIEILTGRAKDHRYILNTPEEMILKKTEDTWRNEYDKFFLTEEQAQVVKDFIAALDNEIEEEKRRAYRSGSNMLARLASGELSIDDVNKMAINREGK